MCNISWAHSYKYIFWIPSKMSAGCHRPTLVHLLNIHWRSEAILGCPPFITISKNDIRRMFFTCSYKVCCIRVSSLTDESGLHAFWRISARFVFSRRISQDSSQRWLYPYSFFSLPFSYNRTKRYRSFRGVSYSELAHIPGLILQNGIADATAGSRAAQEGCSRCAGVSIPSAFRMIHPYQRFAVATCNNSNSSSSCYRRCSV